MTRREVRENEVICICEAYEFPHRLGGGLCTGAAWVVSFRSIDSFDCDGCNHNDNNMCDVSAGIERINYTSCECVANECRTHYLRDDPNIVYLPLDVENRWEKMERDYYHV